MSISRKKLAALAASLPDRDLDFLLDCARLRREETSPPTAPGMLPPFAVACNARYLDSNALAKVEEAFARRLGQARDGRQRLSRLRVWLAFLLLRHGGLRLAEALAFDDSRDVDAQRSLLLVRGPHAREAPLSPPVLARLLELLHAPEAQALRGSLTRLDEGYLRRCLYARAKECGLPPRLLSARSLRDTRGIELCRSGMPLKIVHAFLGQQSGDRTAAFLHYADQDEKTIIRHFLHKEDKMKTSARNVFPGRITAMRHSGVLAEVTLTAFSGLEMAAVVTEESCRTLGLEEGKIVSATVKAPWVILAAPDAAGVRGRNDFAGVVAEVRRAGVASEVLVDLEEGSRVCALITTENADELNLEPGGPIRVQFKAFSVILAAD